MELPIGHALAAADGGGAVGGQPGDRFKVEKNSRTDNCEQQTVSNKQRATNSEQQTVDMRAHTIASMRQTSVVRMHLKRPWEQARRWRLQIEDGTETPDCACSQSAYSSSRNSEYIQQQQHCVRIPAGIVSTYRSSSIACAYQQE